MENIKSAWITFGNSSARSYDQDLMRGAVYFKANLSDVIEGVEVANLYDILQLSIAVILTCLCLGGNLLTILVLRQAARKHPAQALRLTLAAFDLVNGVFGCINHIVFHSYYLWCSINVDQCQYEVEIIQYSNNGQMILIMGIFPLIHLTLFAASMRCSTHMPWIMSVERYFAICKPLKHKIYFSISKIRSIMITLFILMTIQTITWKAMEDTHLVTKCFYKPEIKMNYYGYSDRRITIYEAIHDFCTVTLNVILTITFTSIVRWKLKNVKRLQGNLLNLNKSSNSVNASKGNVNVSVIEENTIPCDRQNTKKLNSTKQDDEVTIGTASVTPKMRSTLTLQAESVLDMTITHTWLVFLEVTTFLLNASVFMYAGISERKENAAPFGTVLYASFWFGMSSSFFNFLLYNIRIPAFRKASWELITSITKVSTLWRT